MKLHVASIQMVENWKEWPKSCAVISITSPKWSQANLKNIDESKVLRLVFHDLDKHYTIKNVDGSVEELPIMSVGHAKQIAEFVFANKDVKHLIVHCEAGISRSAGVAAAISKHFFGDDEEYFNPSGRFMPNRRVYRLVLEALYRHEERE